MKESREKISWKEVYALNKRALCLWCRECPMLFVSCGIPDKSAGFPVERGA